MYTFPFNDAFYIFNINLNGLFTVRWNILKFCFLLLHVFFNMLYVQYNYRIAQSHMFLQQNTGKVLTKVSSSIWFYFWWTDTLCITNLALIGKEKHCSTLYSQVYAQAKKTTRFSQFKTEVHMNAFHTKLCKEQKNLSQNYMQGSLKLAW